MHARYAFPTTTGTPGKYRLFVRSFYDSREQAEITQEMTATLRERSHFLRQKSCLLRQQAQALRHLSQQIFHREA